MKSIGFVNVYIVASFKKADPDDPFVTETRDFCNKKDVTWSNWNTNIYCMQRRLHIRWTNHNVGHKRIARVCSLLIKSDQTWALLQWRRCQSGTTLQQTRQAVKKWVTSNGQAAHAPKQRNDSTKIVFQGTEIIFTGAPVSPPTSNHYTAC